MTFPAPIHYAPVTGVEIGLGPGWSQVMCLGLDGCRGKTKFSRPANQLPGKVFCCWCGREIVIMPKNS